MKLFLRPSSISVSYKKLEAPAKTFRIISKILIQKLPKVSAKAQNPKSMGNLTLFSCKFPRKFNKTLTQTR